MHQIRFLPGVRPGPRWGSSRRSPDPLVGWGGEPSPYLSPLDDAFRVSISAPLASRSRRLLLFPNLFFVPARLVGVRTETDSFVTYFSVIIYLRFQFPVFVTACELS